MELILTTFLIALILVLVSSILQGNIQLDLSDEGYLWYGVTQSINGKVPIADYKSYDPGRYYWCVLFSKVFGTGLLGVRRSIAVFQVLGLWAGLLSIGKINPSLWILLGCGFFLTLWMQPCYKVFDRSLALLSIFFLSLLLSDPTIKVALLAGIFVGISAFMGRNHGLYNSIAYGLGIFWVWWLAQPEGMLLVLLALFMGILIGWLPMLYMLVFVDGFWEKYKHLILLMIRRGTTNLPRRIPWPWRLVMERNPKTTPLDITLSILYVIIPFSHLGILLSGSIGLERQWNWPVLISAGLVGSVYLHYTFSRADFDHILQSIVLWQVSLWIFIGLGIYIWFSIFLLLVLTLVSIVVLKKQLPLVNFLRYRKWFEKIIILNEPFLLPKKQVKSLKSVMNYAKENIGQSELMYMVPTVATLYPILEKTSPVYDIFPVYPQSTESQIGIIANLTEKCVNWAYIVDARIDDREDLRYLNTHPLVWEYLLENFEPVELPELLAGHMVLQRKKGNQLV